MRVFGSLPPFKVSCLTKLFVSLFLISFFRSFVHSAKPEFSVTKQQLADALNKSFKNNPLHLREIAGFDMNDFRQSFETYIVPDKAISEPGAVTTDAVKKDTSDTATKSFEDQIKEILTKPIEFESDRIFTKKPKKKQSWNARE